MSKLDVRIYYEDTDAGGVIYHSNYLKYMERGRTEALRALSFEQHKLAKEEGIIFAVTRSDIHYKFPARLDDVVVVHTILQSAKGVRFIFKQYIYREDKLLVEADVTIACLGLSSGRPKRIPKVLLERLEEELS